MKVLLIVQAVAVFLVLAVATYALATYTVKESEASIVTRLGKIVAQEGPGIHFKVPFLDLVHTYSTRTLDFDNIPNEVITKDKKTMRVDYFCKWKITDVEQFFLALRTVDNALSRLDDVIYSELRNEIGNHDLISVIDANREKIMTSVTEASREKVKEFGIEVVDVRIKRADLPEENEQSVFQRMIADRQKIAKGYRSQGEEEAQKIRSDADKERTIILAEAYRASQEIRGSAEAESIKIYADAYQKDPDFFEFIKKLDFYQESIVSSENSTDIFLTTESELFDLMKEFD